MEHKLECGICLGEELTVKHEKVIYVVWLDGVGLKVCTECRVRPARALVTDKKVA